MPTTRKQVGHSTGTPVKDRSPALVDRPPGQADKAPRALPASGALESIEQAIAKRTPGFSERKKRVAEWKLLEKLRVQAKARREGQPLTELEAEEAAGRAWEEFRRQRQSKAVLEEFEKTAPTLGGTPCPSEVDGDVEIAAVGRLGPIRWLKSYLLEKTNRAGGKANIGLVVATFLRMGFSLGRPEVARTRREIESRAITAWAHDYPEAGPQSTCFNKSLGILVSKRNPIAAIHANLELIRDLAEATDERGRLLHPDAGRVGIVDGMLMEADVEQRAPEKDELGNPDIGHRRLLSGPGRERVRCVAYIDPATGQVRRVVTGYKVIVVSCMALNLPLVWTVAPANCDERAEAMALLELLFELWPECPMEYLVGDSYFDHSKAFAHELLFNFGIVPIFPRAGDYAEALPHVKTEGVPHCRCGEMVFKDQGGDWYSARRRAKEGILRGVPAPNTSARFRWVCPNKLCPNVTTRPFDDPRLYSPLPADSGKRGAKRAALLVRRNQIESIFSALQHAGLAGKGVGRAKWAKDAGAEWLVSAAILYYSARRLAHHNGIYEAASIEAEELGFLDKVSEHNPTPGPSGPALSRSRKKLEATFGGIQQPRTWDDRVHGPIASAA